jgi:hypothetical protein
MNSYETGFMKVSKVERFMKKMGKFNSKDQKS